MVEDLGAFLDHEGNTPREEVHEVWEEVGMRRLHELLYVEGVILGGGRCTSNLITAPLLL